MPLIHTSAAQQLCFTGCPPKNLRSLGGQPLRQWQILGPLPEQASNQGLQVDLLQTMLSQKGPQPSRFFCQCQQQMDAAHIAVSQSPGLTCRRQDQFCSGICISHFIPSR